MTATHIVCIRQGSSFFASILHWSCGSWSSCVPRGHTGARVFHLMDAAAGVAPVSTEVWTSSTAEVLGWTGGVTHNMIAALPQDPEVLTSSTSWTQLGMWVTTWAPLHPHRAGCCSCCWHRGQRGWEVWVTTWASASHQAQRCSRLFGVIPSVSEMWWALWATCAAGGVSCSVFLLWPFTTDLRWKLMPKWR